MFLGFLSLSGASYLLYERLQPADQVIILIADFDGPDPDHYRVTDTMISSLNNVLKPYNDVKVVAIERAINESEASAIVGGGDTVSAIKQLGLEEKFSHVSTGGGATLQYLQGKKLPAIEALKKNIL